MKNETATTKDGTKVTLRTRTVGQNFGTVGQVMLRGRVIAETDTLPLHFDRAALDAARALAERTISRRTV